MRWSIRLLITLVVSLPFLGHLWNVADFNTDVLRESTDILTTAENWAYDARLRSEMSNVKDSDIFIIDIDEKSIKAIGQWPWRRDVIAEIVDNLFSYYGLEVLGFDIAFPEQDRSDDIQLLNLLTAQSALNEKVDIVELKRQLDRDAVLAQSFKARKVILGNAFDGLATESAGVLSDPIVTAGKVMDSLAFFEIDGFTGNLPILQNAAFGAGNFNPITIDADGKIRRIPLLVSHAGNVYESLAFAIARAKLGAEPKDIKFIYSDHNQPTVDSLIAIDLAGIKVPVGDLMTAIIPYRAADKGGFNYVSAADILNKSLSKEAFTASIAIMGSTAAGLRDFRVSPVSENFPGVEIHANIVSGIMTGAIKESPAEHYLMQAVIILLAGLLITFIQPKLPVIFKLLFALFLSFLVYFLNMTLWKNGLLIPIAPSILFILTAFVAHLFYGSFIETRRKRQLTQLFGQYVPPKLVEEMENHLDDYGMQTKDETLTVMFADIKGFTKVSENLAAEQVTQMLNIFLTSMTKIIHAKRGTIDKYMGDAIMAFWGAPLPDSEHAKNALEAALEMTNEITVLNQTLQAKGLPEIDVCIGLNSGNMRVGNMGSSFRMTYTVVGDEVNLAARLEGLTRVYQVPILIGENTRKSLPNITCLELDRVKVKGKENAVTIYQPLQAVQAVQSLDTHETPEFENAHSVLSDLVLESEKAMHSYRQGDWDSAEHAFKRLQSEFPEYKHFELFISRIHTFKTNPPAADWDGVYRYTKK